MGRIKSTQLWSRTIDARLETIIAAIHATPPKVVIEFAGAGSQALAWLHSAGGSSRTILEATDRYAAASLIGAIGFEPQQFSSPGVAQALAAVAYTRARLLAAPQEFVAGVGCAATIATDRLKRGDHRCCLALYDQRGLTTLAVSLTKGVRTRQEEERLISLLIIDALAEVCQVERPSLPQLLEGENLSRRFIPTGPIEQLLQADKGWLALGPDDSLTTGEQWPNLAILSGSFNPLHQGHRQLLDVVARLLGQTAHFELPLVNAGKGAITPAETLRRRAQFTGIAPLLLTTAPLFGQKAKIFPNSVFVVGLDTMERLLQLRFYEDDPAQMLASLDTVRRAHCRFLVAGRVDPDSGRFLTLNDISIPVGYQDLFEQIPETIFRVDVSSTALRKKQDI